MIDYDEDWDKVVYVARFRDGTYDHVIAPSWDAAQRHWNSHPVSIKKRRVSYDVYVALVLGGSEVCRAVYHHERIENPVQES